MLEHSSPLVAASTLPWSGKTATHTPLLASVPPDTGLIFLQGKRGHFAFQGEAGFFVRLITTMGRWPRHWSSGEGFNDYHTREALPLT